MEQKIASSPQQIPQQYSPPPMSSPAAQHYSPPPMSPAQTPGQIPQYPMDPQQQQYIQPQPAIDGQQYYVQQQQPIPGTPVVPVAAYPDQQQYIQPHPVATPVTYTVTATAVPVAEIPKPEIIKGTGMKSYLPQLTFCCFCFPLRHGAIALSAIMMIFQGICGLLLLIGSPLGGGSALSAVLIVVGVLYLILAVFYGYGVAAITREDLLMVKRYVRGFIGCSIVWALLEIASMAIQVSYWNSWSGYGYYYIGFNWGGWIALFLIGLIIQVYFCSCLVSYERELAANERAKAGIVSNDPKAIPLV